MNSRLLKSHIAVICTALIACLQIGCLTTGTDMPEVSLYDPVNTTYQPGDKVLINFADNPGIPPAWEQTVRDDGTITLPFSQTLRAQGMRKGELEEAIRNLYVPKLLTRLTVNVRAEERTYFVSGEVKAPGQRPHSGMITAMKAVAAAGGFTDFANKSRIEVIRANREEKIDVNGKKAQKNPARYDVPVYPGDTVHVHRRWM